MKRKAVELSLTTVIVLVILLTLLIIIITFLSGNLNPMLEALSNFMFGVSGNLNETQI